MLLWRNSVIVCIFILAWAGGSAFPRADSGDDTKTPKGSSFENEIRPLLQAKCLKCHSGKKPKGDLDLSTAEGILKGGESGQVIAPGKPAESLLFEKIDNGTMPPGKKDHLSKAEVETVRRWIVAGAKVGNLAVSAANASIPLNQHDIIPIVLRHCTACHGLRRTEADLDLRTKAGMLRGGKSGPAIVPGQPEESLIIKRIGAEQMPPQARLVEASVKPVAQAELDILTKWIAAGAPEVAIQPDVATTTPDPLVSDKNREFWAFRPPKAGTLPAVQHAGQVRNVVDQFVLHKLEEHGLSLAPEADRLTLLRRACFDLTGLPPTPSEVHAFLSDNNPDAYEKIIDRLLESPRYGERWGNYWLDLAGYADSEGKREQDLPRPFAWRYRDYVIRAFNADKPYDRFLLEQLAGDELAEYENGEQVAPEIYDNLVATGFLRMAPDPTWANITGYTPDRLDVIADEMDILGSAVLGLTMKCCRCHDHKYDPIPQRDYYRLLAVFKGAYDEYDWLKPDIHPGIGPVSQDVGGGRLLSCVSTHEQAEHMRAQLDSRIQALWDRGEPSPTYIYRRGDPLNPGRLVGPGVPSVLTDGKTPFEVKPPWPNAKKTGRRLAFARWVTDPNQPLTSRVMVNRLWQHHFGKGIVKSLDNFGKNGMAPTHPELLDWLAREFVQKQWSMKAMHRLMMTSAVYRQNSAVTPELEKADPDNAWYSRMPLVRLDAEALYDTLLFVSGRLDETQFGPADAVKARPDGLVTPTGTGRGWRRLIYVQHLRKLLPTHLENFDYPQMNPNCAERRESVVVLQALELTNSGMVHDLAEQFARRVMARAGADPAGQIDQVYQLALSRSPTAEEKEIGRVTLDKLTKEWTGKLPGFSNQNKEASARKALTTYCHAILNSAAFLYVD
ncbi:MAG TPA: PSD1 and planctomycete cytochrome C domain-containing protein [Gemmataceae bacterium]|nr:PSD1 and planctomycete cytochrome C domain-containing protein [Gemmataceae bacterium]